jgi:adenylylsulfate kinase-like enzyme
MIYWITGLPGSGKTTFACQLKERIKQAGENVIHLDGDEMRSCLNGKFGYSKSERIFLGKYYLNLAISLQEQGFHIIVSTVSMFQEIYSYLDEKMKDYEIQIVLIDAPNEILDQRNQKRLRTQEIANSPGVSLEIDYPTFFEFRTNGLENESVVKALVKNLISK